MSMCWSGKGTGVNDTSNPNNQAGDATTGRGDCAHSFCLKNSAHRPMKKLIGIVAVLLLAAGLGFGIWRWWRLSRSTGKLPELRAAMQDEDEPPPHQALALPAGERGP